MKPSMSEQLSDLSRNFDIVDKRYRDIPEHMVDGLRERQAIVGQFNWSAKGQMQSIKDGEVRKQNPITIKESVRLRDVAARIIIREGIKEVAVTGFSEEHGEIVPFVSGRFFPERK